MATMKDFGYEYEQTENVDLDGLTYVEPQALNRQTKTIIDVRFYTKDDRTKAIIVFDDETYTVTGGVAIISKLEAIDGKLEDGVWDLSVEFAERTSKKTNKKYMDMF